MYSNIPAHLIVNPVAGRRTQTQDLVEYIRAMKGRQLGAQGLTR